jgi:hypothetical protein
MEHFSEKIKIDKILNHSTGSTTLVYAWPCYDMSNYNHAEFVVNAFNLSPGTATGAVNIMQCAVYTATAATSTALTAISSATASFGSTLTSVLGITGAARLSITCNTASTGTTFSIIGQKMTIQSTANVSSYDVLGGTGVSNATFATSLVNILTSGVNFKGKLIATTDVPAGSTMLSSHVVYVYPAVPGSTTLTATGRYGATANKGILVAGDYVASIGVPAEKMGGARYITIGVKSSGLAVPFSVNLMRSGGRYKPENAGLAADVKLGSTTT